jgi:hypothetical protein
VALIDEDDWERCSQRNWFLVESKHGSNTWMYAASSTWDGKKNTRKYLHHFVLGIKERVDHVNGNGLDNRKKNLRRATAAQNRHNSKRRSDNKSSKFLGVRKRKDCKRWEARIRGRSVGHFDTEIEAATAYDQAAKKEYGDFARLNGVTE